MFQYNEQVSFVLDQHALLNFYSAGSLKQQSMGRHVAPRGHIILIHSQPVCSLSLMLRVSTPYTGRMLWC
jgi:hypothetical protein